MKPIPSTPEYLISIDGIVTKKDKILTVNRNGSIRVSIRRRMRLVSELLAETYLGMPCDSLHSVIYLDGNPMNIDLSNLMWVDRLYSQIKVSTLVFDGEMFHQASCLETKQYYVSASGSILNFATKRTVNPTLDSIGYRRFTYYVPNDSKLVKRTIAVHILVYLVFKGEYDRTKFEINHIDGNKENNHVSNLEIVDHKENVRHAVRTRLKKVKYTEEHIGKVIAMLKEKYSWTEIFDNYLCPELNLTKTQAFSLINSIANNKNAYAEKCKNLGFVKGSTTRAQRSYTTS